MKSMRGLTLAGLAAILWCCSPGVAQTVGDAETFAVLGGQSVTAAGTGTTIDGHVGVSPGTSITGFPGSATVLPPFSTHSNDGPAIAAQTATTALYVSLDPGSCASPSTPELDMAEFIPGTYCFSSTANLASNGTLTLRGAGTYIFQIGSSITAGTGSNVVFLDGADPCDVFWQVTEAATLNGVTFVGTVVAQAGVTVGVGATLIGRALTTAAGSVTMAGTNTLGGCSTIIVADTPTATPTDTNTATNTPTATSTATATSSATETASPTPTDTPSQTATASSSATASATATATETETPSSTATATPTSTATQTPTVTATQTVTPSPSATRTRPPIPLIPSPTSGAGLSLILGLGLSMLWLLRVARGRQI